MDHCLTETFHFHDDGTIPNNCLPLIIFRNCLENEQQTRDLLKANGWGGIWVNGVYDYQHFHSTAHEFLGVLQGSATLLLGGEEEGQVIEVAQGDALVLPAGTGHRCLNAGPAFKILGAYPGGQDSDVCRGESEDYDRVRDNIARVPMPAHDPVHGDGGALLQLWQNGSKCGVRKPPPSDDDQS